VVVSTTPIEVLLPRLRDLGLAPVVEAEDGTVRVARPDVHRARSPRSRPTGREAAREGAHVAAAVAAVRAGDRAAAARPAAASAGSTPAESLAALRDAIEARASVWIGYVDNHGTTTERIVDPQRVEGGQLTAYDHRSEDLRGFAVHRITAVRPVDAATGRPSSPAP
jgi:predicted DNA-binding transcriptional regulator YafY